MGTVQCRRCQTIVPDYARFCKECGALVYPEIEEHVVTEISLNPLIVYDPAQNELTQPASWSGIADQQDIPPPVLSQEDIEGVLGEDPHQDPYQLAENARTAQLDTRPVKDTDDDDDDLLPIPIFMLREQVEAPELRAEHRQPGQMRGAHKQPEQMRGTHTQPGQMRGNHQQPVKARALHKQVRPHLAVIGTTAVAITGVVAALVIPLLGANAQQHTPAPPSAIISTVNTSGAFPGGSLALHGRNFLPNGTVTISADGNQLSDIESSLPMTTLSGLKTGSGTNVADGTLQSTVVNKDGTFDTTISIPPEWKPNTTHTIDATEESSGQSASAEVQFTTQPLPTPVPTATPRPRPTPTPAPVQPTPIPQQPAPIIQPTATPIPVPVVKPTPVPVVKSTPTPVPVARPTPTPRPIPTPTPIPPTPTPRPTPTPVPTAQPTPQPTVQPTAVPTRPVRVRPTPTPTPPPIG